MCVPFRLRLPKLPVSLEMTAPSGLLVLAFSVCLWVSVPRVAAQTSSDCGQRVELSLCRGDARGLELTALSDSGGLADCDYLWLTRYRLEGSLRNRRVRVRPDRDTCYLLRIDCPAGCVTTDTFCIRLGDPPELEWQLPEYICSGDTSVLVLRKNKIEVDDIRINWDAIRWIDIQKNDTAWIYRVVAPDAGFYTLMAEARSMAGCRASARGVVRVRQRPTVEAGADRVLCAGDSLYLQARSQVFVTGRCRARWQGAVRFDQPFALETAVWADSSAVVEVQVACEGCWSEPDSLHLQVLPRPRVEADTHLLAFCRDQAGVRLPVRVEGGTPPYFARWAPPVFLDDPLSVSPFAVPPRDTAWTLSLLDDAGCSAAPLTLRVRVHEIPIADAGPNLFLCGGKPDTLRLRGRVLRPDSTPVPPQDWGRYAVQWAPSEGLSDPASFNPVVQPDTTTIYTLTLRDRLTGCSNRITILDTLATAVVYVIPPPVADAGPDTLWVCSGEAVQLGGIASGGDGLDYVWQPAVYLDDPTAANPIARPLRSTRYTVQTARGSCLGEADSIEIIVRERPVVRLDGPRDVCDGDTLPLFVQARGGSPPYAYDWSPSERIVGLGNGFGWLARYPETVDLEIRIRDRFCSGEEPGRLQAAALPRPVVSIAEEQLRICQGDSVRIQTQVLSPLNAYRIRWTPSDSLYQPDARSPLAFPAQTTLYYVVANIGPCASTDSVLVAVLPVPVLRIEGGPPRLCEGQNVEFRAWADPADRIGWSWYLSDGSRRALAGPVLEDQPPTPLRYRAEATLGPCTTAVEVPVEVFPQAVADFEPSSVQGCGVWDVAFRNTSRNADTFAWDFGDNWGISSLREPTYRYLEAGRWWVQLIAGPETPCPDTLRLPVELRHTPLPDRAELRASFRSDEILFLPRTEVRLAWRSSQLARGFWDLGDGSTATDSVVWHRYRQAGDYQIRLIWEDSVGCLRIDSLPLLRVREPELDIPTVFTPNGDGINDRWEIHYTGVEPFALQVYDRQGQLLFEGSSPAQPWAGTDRRGSTLPEGLYFYVLHIGGQVHRGYITLLR